MSISWDLNSSVVHAASEIIYIWRARARTKAFYPAFARLTISPLALPLFGTKIGTAATFSITLVSNSSSEKLSSSASVIMATTTVVTCLEGVIPHEVFSWFYIESLDTNSKGKHNRTHTFAISVRRSSCWPIKSHKPKAASLFTIFKKLQYNFVLLSARISSVQMYKKCSELLSNIALLGRKCVLNSL